MIDYLPSGLNLISAPLITLDGRALRGKEVIRERPARGAQIRISTVPGDPASIGVAVLVSLILSAISFGIQALIAPRAPSSSRTTEEDQSYQFSSVQNTVGDGVPIPFGYGECRCGGHFLQSFEKESETRTGTTDLYTLMALGICGGDGIESVDQIEINGVPIETIPDVDYEVRIGTPGQAVIPGFGDVRNEEVYTAPIRKDEGPLTFVTKRDTQAIEVIFRFPSGLFSTTKKGAIQQYEVSFLVEYRELGRSGPWLPVGTKTCSSSTRNPLKEVFRLKDLDLARYEVRVTRATIDDDNQSDPLRFISTSEVFALVEIVDEEQSYPGMVLVGFRQQPSAQLNGSAPQEYTFRVRWKKGIRVYSDEVTYTPAATATRNPAWQCADFLTWPLGGMGDRYRYEDHIDIPAFIQWAAHCESQVDNGAGVLEARCEFGHRFDRETNAQEILESFRVAGEAIIFKKGNKWSVLVDQEEEIVYLANAVNILPGTLEYREIPKRERATRILLRFKNEDESYLEDSYPDEDPDLLPGEEYLEETRNMVGVNRLSQIIRAAQRFIRHNKFGNWAVSYRATIEALPLAVGRVFGLNLLTVGIGAASGKLLKVSPDGTRASMNKEVTFETGKEYECTIEHASGKIDLKPLINPPGKSSELLFADGVWKETLAVGATFCAGVKGGSAQRFRCTRISTNADLTRDIEGLLYDDAVYSAEANPKPMVVPTSLPDPNALPPVAEDLTLTERTETNLSGVLETVLDVDWSSVASLLIGRWEVYYAQKGQSGWKLAGETLPGNTHIEIRGLESPGVVYTVAVVSVSPSGKKLDPGQSPRKSILTTGVTTQPPDLAGISVTLINGTIYASVSPIPPDILGPGGYYQWRIGETWDRAKIVVPQGGPVVEITSYPHADSINVMVAAFNSIGNRSANVAMFNLKLYGQVDEDIVYTRSEATEGWSGMIRTGFEIVTNRLEMLQLVGSRAPRRRIYQRGRALRFGYGAPSAVDQAVPLGIYEQPPIQLTTIADGILVRPDVRLDYTPLDLGLGTFAGATFPFGSPGDMGPADRPFSAEVPDDVVKVTVLQRVSFLASPDPNIAANWSSWTNHVDRGEVTARWIQFAVRVDILPDQAWSVQIHEFSTTIDLPEKKRAGTIQILSAVAFDYDYTPAGYFVDKPRLLLGTDKAGAYVEAPQAEQSKDGFQVALRLRSNDALTTGTVYFQATGA